MTAPAVETRRLSKTYKAKTGEVLAVQDLDLRVEAGEIFGLLGPNGAGKTTTIRMLCGLLRPSNGDAWIDGVPIEEDPVAARSRIGLVPEDAGNHKNLTVSEELAYYGALYGLDRATVTERSAPLVDRLGLAEHTKKRLSAYSKGMRRKVHLIRALLHRPKVLLLDEPTAGLDPAVAEEVWQLLQELAAEHHVTVILCSHHLEEVERLCGRVAILKQRLLVQGTLEALSGRDGRYRIRLAGAAEPHAAALADLPGATELSARGEELSFRAGDAAREVVPEAVRRLVAAGASILAVEPQDLDLRSLYRETVRGNGNHA